MTEPDPTFGMIATMFHDLAVAKSRGGYTLIDPYSGTPLARLKPIPHSDRFELFYWSDIRAVGARSVTPDNSNSPSSGPMKYSAPNQSFTATPAAELAFF